MFPTLLDTMYGTYDQQERMYASSSKRENLDVTELESYLTQQRSEKHVSWVDVRIAESDYPVHRYTLSVSEASPIQPTVEVSSNQLAPYGSGPDTLQSRFHSGPNPPVVVAKSHLKRHASHTSLQSDNSIDQPSRSKRIRYEIVEGRLIEQEGDTEEEKCLQQEVKMLKNQVEYWKRRTEEHEESLAESKNENRRLKLQAQTMADEAAQMQRVVSSCHDLGAKMINVAKSATWPTGKTSIMDQTIRRSSPRLIN